MAVGVEYGQHGAGMRSAHQVGQQRLGVQRARVAVEGGGLVTECPERGDVLCLSVLGCADQIDMSAAIAPCEATA